MKVSFEFSHFFSVFFFRLGLEFDDFSDGIDEVAEGHAADNFYYWDKEALKVVGRDDLAEADGGEDGGPPIPADHILLYVGVIRKIFIVKPCVVDAEGIFNWN